MLLQFTTKRDYCGNRYTLIIDTEAKTVKRDYNPHSISDYVEIKHRDREALYNNAISNGFKEI
jgi:protein tyrosine phosphatase